MHCNTEVAQFFEGGAWVVGRFPVAAFMLTLPVLVVYNARIAVDARCSPWDSGLQEVAVQTLWQDLRYGFRTLRNSPGFTVVAILTLALGVGATSAVFSTVDRVLFRSLPYPADAQLVSFGFLTAKGGLTPSNDYLEWRKSPLPFAQMASMLPFELKCDFTEQNPIRMTCAWVDAYFLPTFGIQPILGRNFTPEDCRLHSPRVGLLSYGLWRSRYGGDLKIVGRSISLDEKPVEIVGVLPAEFEMPTLVRADVLVPEVLDGQPALVLRTFGRLKPGVTISQAGAALQPFFDQAMKFYPPALGIELHPSVQSLRDRQMGDAKLASWVLLLAVFAVLLLAATNVANLLLARAAARQREVAVRVALGATRVRLARQALTESMLLSLAGAAAGCWVAYGLLRLFVSIAPQGIPRLQQAAIDHRVLLFALTVALVSGLLFGLAPAWRRTSPEILTGNDAQPIGRGRLRQILVTSQIAVSLVLLTGAGLLLRSLWRLESIPLGMDVENIVTAEMMLMPHRYPQDSQQWAFFDQLHTRLKAIPGVGSVALSDELPPEGGQQTRYSDIEIAGRPRTPEGAGGLVRYRQVTPGYFSTLEAKILRGREFNDDDLFPSQNVVILSNILAHRLFASGDALGESIRIHSPENDNNPWRTVVGVAADVRNNGLALGSDPEFYIPWKNDPEEYIGHAFVIIRTPLNPDAIAKWLRSEVASLDPTQPVTIELLAQRVSQLAERPRFNAVLLTLFAVTGVCLAAVGLFGVVGYLVTQRTREIGVRMALGATPRNILRLVLRSVARWTLAGALAGFVGSWFTARLLQSLVFEVSVHDPWLLCVPIVLLIAIAFLAGLIPATRAMRVDPMVALRHE
jgi:putative ABC transport system permease protein